MPTIPTHQRVILRVPEECKRIALQNGIPLNSLTMAPVVNTTDGTLLFDNYIRKIHDARAQQLSQSESPRNAQSPSEEGKIVMIHNLVPEKISCHDLFVLCGAFGDVHRVKIMFNKRDTAFVQMATPMDAKRLILYLQGFELMGNSLVLIRSKMKEIRLPYQGRDQKTMHLTKDYSNSPSHRFGSPDSKNRRYICKPSKILHVSNLPHGFMDTIEGPERLKLILSDNRIKGITLANDSPTQCLLICDSVDDGMQVLITKHLFRIEDKYIHVEFTSSCS